MSITVQLMQLAPISNFLFFPSIRICNPNVLSIRIFNPKDRLSLRIVNAHTQYCRITNPAGRKEIHNL